VQCVWLASVAYHRCHSCFTERGAGHVEHSTDQQASGTATIDGHPIGTGVELRLQVFAASDKVRKGVLLVEQLHETSNPNMHQKQGTASEPL
jgi:hypothetical protein